MHDDDANDLTKAAYLRRLKYLKRSDKTISSYLWWIDDLIMWLDGDDVTLADQADMEDYFAYRFDDLKDSSALVAFRTLRAFFNWCVFHEIADVSPMAKLEMPSAERRDPEIVADDDLAALFKQCEAGKRFEDRRDLAIVRIFNEPGTPRCAEMAGIMLENVDLKRSKLTFCGKGNLWRTIYLGIKSGDALDRYLRMRRRHPLAGLPNLWLGQHGKPLTDWGIRQMLERRCDQAGVKKIRPHDIRHKTFHHWREEGGSEEDAESLFGWSEGSRMPRHYGRSQKLSRAEKAARKMSLGDRI